MNILFIDDHALLRQSVAAQLRTAFPEATIEEGGSLAEARALLEKGRYDMLLTDLVLGEGGSEEGGLELASIAARLRGGIPVIVLSMHADPGHIEKSIRAGAKGYVTKSSEISILADAIRVVGAGGFYFDQSALSAIVGRIRSTPVASVSASDFSAYGELTEREQEVFLLLAQGGQLAEIAHRLGISPKTVENHRSNIYAKLGLSDRLSAYRYARELGLVG